VAIPLDSPLHLENDSTPRGSDWWDWSIWVDGPSDALEEVESVTYRLHPTFPNPVQKVTDRKTSFRMSSSGWGEFLVAADVRLQSGRTLALERWLELRDADGHRPSDTSGAGGRRPRVFISASAVDGDLVAELAEELQAQGIETRREQDVGGPGFAWKSSLDEEIESADGVVAVFSEPQSSWVKNDFEKATALRKPTFPVIRSDAKVPLAVTQVVRFELKERGSVAGLANTIAARLKDCLVDEA
jgi:hypothetical protein